MTKAQIVSMFVGFFLWKAVMNNGQLPITHYHYPLAISQSLGNKYVC